MLLAVQHTQAVQTLHQECASIRQDFGGLQTEITILKSDKLRLEGEVSDLKHLRSQIHGGAKVLGFVLAGLLIFCWFFVGPTWTTLQKMAKEYEVHAADEQAAKEATQGQINAVAAAQPPASNGAH